MPGRGFSKLQGLPFLSNQAKRDIEVVFNIKLYLFIIYSKCEYFSEYFSRVVHIQQKCANYHYFCFCMCKMQNAF